MTNDTDHADAVAIAAYLTRIVSRGNSDEDTLRRAEIAAALTVDLCDGLDLCAESVALEGTDKASAMGRLQ